jgi:RNA polymerase sigma-70 factor (ECF subfamily)
MNFALILTSNREEAKDLLQETTLRALDNREKYYENVNFKGWVFTIMHNIFVNNYRRVVRSQTMIDQTENLYHLNMPQDSGFETPEGAYTVSEISRVINSFSDLIKVHLPASSIRHGLPYPSRLKGYCLLL